MAMLILLVLLIFFAALGVPLAFAIGASCVSYILIYAPNFITMLPQRVWNGAYSELMIAMPLFMLAGELMNTGGITQRIINFCMELLRPVRGGLGEVNIVASMIFGGISGSSVADTSALGSILIPAMEKEGYPPEASAGITVASSTMGMIIPPSTPMIVYSMISGASVGALFMAGAVPGILIGLTQLVLVYIISAKKGWHPAKAKFDAKRAAKSLLSGIPALIMPVFIIHLRFLWRLHRLRERRCRCAVLHSGGLLRLQGADLEGCLGGTEKDPDLLLLHHAHHRLYHHLHMGAHHAEGAADRGRILHVPQPARVGHCADL
jgi:TRAP-type mannitol/chloroaromatic compound transport system permease large subunit